MTAIENEVVRRTEKKSAYLQVNCTGLLSTEPDHSAPRTAFVAYPGSGSTYIRSELAKDHDVLVWRVWRLCFITFCASEWCWSKPQASLLWWERLVTVSFLDGHFEYHLPPICILITHWVFMSWFLFWIVGALIPRCNVNPNRENKFTLKSQEGCFLSFTHHTALDSTNRDYTQQKAPISPHYRWVVTG